MYVVSCTYKSDLPTEEKLSQNCTGSAEERRTGNGEKQIPFRNDRKKGKGKGKGKGNGKRKGNGNSKNAGISPLVFGYASGSVERTGLWWVGVRMGGLDCRNLVSHLMVEVRFRY